MEYVDKGKVYHHKWANSTSLRRDGTRRLAKEQYIERFVDWDWRLSTGSNDALCARIREALPDPTKIYPVGDILDIMGDMGYQRNNAHKLLRYMWRNGLFRRFSDENGQGFYILFEKVPGWFAGGAQAPKKEFGQGVEKCLR